MTHTDIFKKNYHIINETRNFVVIPSEGSIVPGWVLVIPKNSALRYSEICLDFTMELEDLISNLTSKIQKEFGIKPTIFEHGPQCLSQSIGCSVDYAHLHLVPLNFSLVEEVCLFENKITFVNLNSISQLAKYQNDYLLVKEPNDYFKIATDFTKSSQYIRKIIANKLAVPEKYDWKIYPFQNNINKTVHLLL